MKKQVVLLGMVLALGLAVGCGSKESAGSVTEASVESKTVVGVVDEITDYYFCIQVEDGTYYQFPIIEENESDISNVVVGDTIEITYEGELSDVDMFDGVLTEIKVVE